MKKQIIFILLFVPILSFAQRGKTGFLNRKIRPIKEYVIGIGAANFLGELGGANQVGTHFIKDFEFSTTRPSLALGMRYKFSRRLAIKGGFYYQRVSGDDKLTKEPFRRNRNLSFRSNIFELSAQAEFFLTRDVSGHRYNIRNVRGMRNHDFQAYLFAGIGGFYFNPKAKYQNKWVELQPLGTEGEGLKGGPKKYHRVSACIPYGIGAKDALTKEWSVGVEIGMRYTFTDYIDDVSGVYYDNNAIKAARGPMAAHLADPSLSNYPEEYGGAATSLKQTAPGQARGHSNHKDAYMFINITAAYKIPYKRRTRSKF